jgi:hypothetical protein
MEKHSMWRVHICHPSYSRKHKIGGWRSRPVWTKSETLPAKEAEQKGLEHEALSSKLSTAKKKHKKTQPYRNTI